MLSLKDGHNYATSIENALNPVIFKETLESLVDNEAYKITVDINGAFNTDFLRTLKISDVENFFNDNNGENKILFAKQYVKILSSKEDESLYMPEWVKEIKKEFC